MPPTWNVDSDIPWDRFEPAKVNAELLEVVKAAAMVESNADDYASYLCNVFADDAEFQTLAREWAVEEVQHGVALGRWARLADPSFDYEERLARFRDGYRIDTDSNESVRGSRSGELVARCMVEVGTSSYYTAIADSAEEPLLIELCRRIATDEWRHYAMFYKALKRYLDEEKPSRLRRLYIAVSRAAESEDDELAYAFFAANAGGDSQYDRKESARRYMERAVMLYRPRHVERAMGMIFKAAGFEPHGLASRVAAKGVTFYLGHKTRRLAAA